MENVAAVDSLQWEVIWHPQLVKNWLQLVRGVASLSHADSVARANAVNVVFERAVRAIPYSYKLWTNYIQYRVKETVNLCSVHEWFQSIRELYDRALDKLPKMPLLWTAYLQFVLDFPLVRITMARHIIGRSLGALPATQHYLIWKLAKKMCTKSYIPEETVLALWRVYLLFDNSTRAMREYLFLLFQRKGYHGFIGECVHLFKDGRSGTEELFADANLWESVQLAFSATGWYYTESWSDLEQLVGVGQQHCASPMDFMVSYAVFLYGQGRISDGRRILMRLLEESPDAHSFSLVYRVAVEVEDQLLETFALNEDVSDVSATTYMNMMKTVFGSQDALSPMRTLANIYPLLLNQASLRNHPQSVLLWLKRIELVREQVLEGSATSEDVHRLYRQAIAQCTSGMEEVNPAVGQLIESFAKKLMKHGHHAEAARVLEDGAWHTPFTCVSVNLMLIGLLSEIQLMSGTPHQAVVDGIVGKLSLRPSHSEQRGKGDLLRKRLPRPQLIVDARPWLLALDICIASCDEGHVEKLMEFYAHSSAYTAEGGCYAAAQLRRCGYQSASLRELERCLTHVESDPASLLFVIAQYMSFLCVEFGSTLSMNRFRELAHMADKMFNLTIHTCGPLAVEVQVCCAIVEMRLGLYGNCVRILHKTAHCAVKVLDADANLALLQGLLETAINSTVKYRGLQETRTFCSAVSECIAHPLLLHRLALHWAALEKRCGHLDRSHTVLNAYGDSQDPSTPHGGTYWRLWESLCSTLEQFEGVARRKQQVEVRYASGSVV